VLWSVLAVVAGLGALVGMFLHGVTVRADVLREPLERVLTRALGAPTRIEGPVRLRTGLSVQISADALVVADPVDADAPPLARGTAPSARIDLGALFGRVVILAELTGDRLELQLARAADGRANWTPLFAPSSGGGSFSFGGIQRIHIDHVEGTYRSPGRDRPLRFAVASFEGSLGARTPVTAHGITTVAGHAMEVDLRTASLADLAAARDSIPFTLSLASAGAQLELKGNYSISTAALDASFTLMAANADAPLAAAEVAVHDAGALDARGQLRVSASEATVTDLVLRLGQSSASGTVRVAWGSTKPHLALNLAAERIDLAPFVTAPDATPEQSDAEALLKAIHAIAIGPEIDAKLAIAELSGAGTPVHDLRLDAHNGASTLALHVDGDVSGISLTGTLDYTEQAAQRTLTARLEGGQMSTGALPPGARPTEISGAVGNVHARAHRSCAREPRGPQPSARVARPGRADLGSTARFGTDQGGRRTCDHSRDARPDRRRPVHGAAVRRRRRAARRRRALADTPAGRVRHRTPVRRRVCGATAPGRAGRTYLRRPRTPRGRPRAGARAPCRRAPQPRRARAAHGGRRNHAARSG
jgi:hypothetical protein